ncbi:MAG: hypothetical protein R3E89_05545 [Thiolinea sp.]
MINGISCIMAGIYRMDTLPLTLDILYQDTQLVAINKPAGLLVHRSLIDKHETRFAVQLLRDQLGQRFFRCTAWTNPPPACCCLHWMHRRPAC